MVTPIKPPILAVVALTDWGEATVEFPDVGLSGSIQRKGKRNYIAFAEDGSPAGKAARYESAARVLAEYLGLRRRYMIDVKIVDGISRQVQRDTA